MKGEPVTVRGEDERDVHGLGIVLRLLHPVADALKLTRKILLETDRIKRHEPEELMPGPQLQTEEESAGAAGKIGTTIFHLVGTCRMGTDQAAEVDDELRVCGVEGLRVVDASVMPTITSGNTAALTIMIAEKASAMVLEAAK